MDRTIPAAQAPPQDQVRPRRPWHAAVLSILAPGVGHLYAGRPGRALAVTLLYPVAVAGGVALAMLLAGRPHLIVLAFVALGIPAAVAFDAADSARDQGRDYQLRAYNRWYVYVALGMLLAFAWQPLTSGRIKEHLAESYRLPSGAMEPTLLIGDYITSARLRAPPTRSELAVFLAAGGPTIKRVMGLPGDTLQMQNGVLSVNGAALDEPYAKRDSADFALPDFDWQRNHLPPDADRERYRPTVHHWGPLVVPAGHYFLMGDNRSNSADSRYLGFIPGGSIIGQPRAIYFSRDPETGAVRWRRIGRSVER